MADIFLSYSRNDRDIAESLAGILPKYGWTLYWDRQLLAGEVYDDVLEREINAARCVIVLWSAKSVASQWVRNEAGEGAERNAMVSVLIEDVKLPLAFRRIQAANLIGWRGDSDDARLAELAKAVSAVLGRSGESPAINAAAAASVSEPRPAAGTWPSGLPSEAWLAGLKQNLAEHLGPFASVVVDRELRASKSAEDLLNRVSSEIPNRKEREQFLKSTKLPGGARQSEAFSPAPSAAPEPVATSPQTIPSGPVSTARGMFAVAQIAQVAPVTPWPAAAPLPEEPVRKRSAKWMIAAAGAVLLAGGLLVYTLISRDSGDLQVSPARIDWTAAAGSTQISVDGGTFAFEVTSRSPWISIQPGRGTAPTRVNITRKPSPGLAGPHDGELLVRRLDPSGQTKTVSVHLNAAPPISLPGSLLVSSTALSLNEHEAKGQVKVSSSAGPRSFSVRVTRGKDWLTVQPSSGSTPAVLDVGYLSARAPAGNSAGEFVCETEDGQRFQIAVSLTVRAGNAPAPVRVDAASILRSLTYKVVPVYPETARLARIQGPVKFAARIGKDGSVESLHLVGGHPLLVKAAADAVIRFRYKPTLVNGQPVVITTEITVNFTLQ